MVVYRWGMPETNAWSKYVDMTSGGDYNSAIAHKVGVDPATVGRWRTGANAPAPRQVVDYARAYNQNPLAALIAAGYLTADEIGLPITIPDTTVHDFDTVTLAEELVSRLRDAEPSPTYFLHTNDIGDDVGHIAFTENDGRSTKDGTLP